MLKALIVEDDFDDMQYCSVLLENLNKDIILFKAGSGKEAMDMLLENDIDIAFIDVRLPDFSGFTLAAQIRSIKRYRLLKIIFITAENSDPLSAYRRFHCYDYITKPFMPGTFNQIAGPLLESLDEQDQQQPESKRDVILLETGDRKFVMQKDHILFAESAGRGINVQLKERFIKDIKITLDELILYVDQPSFVRCHKSFAVNLAQVKTLDKRTNRSWDVAFYGDVDASCCVGRTYYKAVVEKLREMGKENE